MSFLFCRYICPNIKVPYREWMLVPPGSPHSQIPIFFSSSFPFQISNFELFNGKKAFWLFRRECRDSDQVQIIVVFLTMTVSVICELMDWVSKFPLGPVPPFQKTPFEIFHTKSLIPFFTWQSTKHSSHPKKKFDWLIAWWADNLSNLGNDNASLDSSPSVRFDN